MSQGKSMINIQILIYESWSPTSPSTRTYLQIINNSNDCIKLQSWNLDNTTTTKWGFTVQENTQKLLVKETNAHWQTLRLQNREHYGSDHTQMLSLKENTEEWNISI